MKKFSPAQQSDALVARLREACIAVTDITATGTRPAAAMLDHNLRARIMSFLHGTLVA